MKTLTPCVLLLLLAFSLRAGDDKSELDALQGFWEVVSLTEKGKESPKTEIESLTVTIDKDAFTTWEKDKVLVKYRIKIDPSKTPKAIDFTALMGDTKDKTEPGIYTFEKDLLKMVLNEDRKDRPTVFEGKETESYSVLVLRKKAE